jgi:hypothetical protein
MELPLKIIENFKDFFHDELLCLCPDNYLDLTSSITDGLMFTACKKSYIGLVKYLLKTNYRINENDLFVAAYNGHIDVLKAFVDTGYELKNYPLLFYAGNNKTLDCIKYVYGLGCKWEIEDSSGFFSYSNAGYLAIMNNDFQCYKYCIENGCECSNYHLGLAKIMKTSRKQFITYIQSKGVVDNGADAYETYYRILDVLKEMK